MRRVARAAALLLLTALAACGRSDPERELRATIAAMAQAVEQREAAAVLDSVAEDFTRESGAFAGSVNSYGFEITMLAVQGNKR
jgi:predicted small lipoprotein YifL